MPETAERARPAWRRVPAPVVAISAVTVLVVALVGATFILHPPPGSGASPSSAVSTPPPPSSTPSASPSGVGDWQALAAAYAVGASWSPDGEWLAVWDRAGDGASAERHLRLLDSAGKPVRELTGDRLLWVDATRFVLSRGDASLLGAVDSTDSTPLPTPFPEAALSNNHGAVALPSVEEGDPAATTFVVWTQTGATPAVTGLPEAWSADGTKLAVWHSTESEGPHGIGSQETGWIEVLSWPGLASLASVKEDSLVSEPMSFDPSGRYLVVSRLGFDGYLVLDTVAGGLVAPSGVTGFTPAWNSASELLVPAVDGSVTTYSLSGKPPVTTRGVGNGVVASADGSTLVFHFTSSESARGPVTVVRGGVSRTVQVPGRVESVPVVSADGSGVIIICLAGNEQRALLLVD